MNVPQVVKVRCNWCSKERESFRVHTLQSQQVICDYCLEWHVNAMNFLGGDPPAGCQECTRTWDQLRAADPLDLAVRIYVVQKDGIYQMLCQDCIVPYTEQRSDLYRNTRFAHDRQL